MQDQTVRWLHSGADRKPRELTGYDEALAHLLSAAPVTGAEDIGLETAAGRTLAAPIVAPRDRPTRDLAAMDGYAIRSASPPCVGARFSILGEAYPGKPFEGAVSDGEAVRVTTGAALPAGAGRVVMDEIVSATGRTATIISAVGPKPHVRPIGSDFRRGDELVLAGARLTATTLMAAAAAEAGLVSVIRQPRVAIMTTGDELAAPSGPVGRDQIPDSVSIALCAMVADWGGCVAGLGRSGDETEKMSTALAALLEGVDVVVVIGGASGSERDQSRAASASAGAELVFDGVAIKPGKPAWAARRGRQLVVGLPGNPIAALVAARLFVAPLIARMASGSAQAALGWRTAPILTALEPGIDRDVILSTRVTSAGLDVLSRQESASHRQLAELNALVRRRPHCPAAAAGDQVDYLEL